MTQESKDKFISDKELFEIAKDTRDFEIRMFWQRTNYFLLLNSAVGGAFLYFLPKSNEDNITVSTGCIMLAFCIIGLFVCFAWMKICLGSKFWQVHWEQVLVELQPYIGLTEYEKDIFSAEHSINRVKKNQESDRKRKRDSKREPSGRLFALYNRYICWLDRQYDCCVLTKPSVSRWMYYTACFFLFVWLLAGIGSICIINYAC